MLRDKESVGKLQNFQALQPCLSCLHINRCLPLLSLPSIWGKGWGWRGSSPFLLPFIPAMFLVHNWSSVCQSPRTHQWSSSQKRWAGSREWADEAECEQQLEGVAKAGPSWQIQASCEQKNLFLLTYLFPWLISASPFHRGFTPGWEHPSLWSTEPYVKESYSTCVVY